MGTRVLVEVGDNDRGSCCDGLVCWGEADANAPPVMTSTLPSKGPRLPCSRSLSKVRRFRDPRRQRPAGRDPHRDRREHRILQPLQPHLALHRRDAPQQQAHRRRVPSGRHAHDIADTILDARVYPEHRVQRPVGADAEAIFHRRGVVSLDEFVALGDDVTDDESRAWFAATSKSGATSTYPLPVMRSAARTHTAHLDADPAACRSATD